MLAGEDATLELALVLEVGVTLEAELALGLLETLPEVGVVLELVF